MTEHLYRDDKLKIDYFPNHTDDHLVYILDGNSGEELSYILPRGILDELARTPRGGIEDKLQWSFQQLLFALKKEKITLDGFHVAICQAFMEEEKRFAKFKEENNHLIKG
ncbi:MAG: hypothetical protein Q8R00_02085 [Candidatus Nanoarchaeia archaeon]|nr:hypothetical protein [Candidatus Nanoarchaeia archaeon]